MKKEFISIETIPAILWGPHSHSIYIYVHGKLANKEEAESFAEKAVPKGFQVLSFDLPEHGERTNERYPCAAWNGVHDLTVIGQCVRQRWENIFLYASSLGAYLSLLAYKDLPLKKCLFLSPILNMEHLIRTIMACCNISEETLRTRQEIQTPMGETLNWDYYCYARTNPIDRWATPTAILCGSKDNLTERKITETFARQFLCDLTILKGGEHWFHTRKQLTFLSAWLDQHI